MIEAVMFWNEPNNKSHWDFEVYPNWDKFSAMERLAGEAVASIIGPRLIAFQIVGIETGNQPSGINGIDSSRLSNADPVAFDRLDLVFCLTRT